MASDLTNSFLLEPAENGGAGEGVDDTDYIDYRLLLLLLCLESKILKLSSDRVKKLGFVPNFVDFPWESLIHWEEWRGAGLGEGWGRRTVDGIENEF